jgi:hypothetical protein
MKHIIFIRAHFKDEDLFKKYMTVSKEVLLPQLNSQTNKNFTVCFSVYCDEHKDIISDLLDSSVNRMFTNNLYMDQEFMDYIRGESYDIQTRHDIDDWMSSDYIDEVQKTWTQHQITNPNESKLLIQSQPRLFNFNTKETTEMKKQYSKEFVSMHLSLCQKGSDSYIFDQEHPKMYRVTENIETLPLGLTRLVIHGNNISSSMSS